MATHAFFLLPFLLCWPLALSAGVHNLLTITCFVCVCVFLSFSLSPGSFLPFYPKENNSIDRALFGLYGLFGLFALVST
jgi:hypothetical protein